MESYLFEKEYSKDFVRWSAVYDSVRDIKIKDGYSPELEDIQNAIIRSNDSALAYFFACYVGYKNYRMQNIILKEKEDK